MELGFQLKTVLIIKKADWGVGSVNLGLRAGAVKVFGVGGLLVRFMIWHSEEDPEYGNSTSMRETHRLCGADAAEIWSTLNIALQPSRAPTIGSRVPHLEVHGSLQMGL